MSGLLALLDDVAAIARLASTQIDDIAAQTAKAGSKAAGVVIDDAAVTPKYVRGLPAARELPIVWKIARASFFNKLVILLPLALLLDTFAPWLLTPLLMLGGSYLCFEGAEKVAHLVFGHGKESKKETAGEPIDAAHLEEKRVKGAIKTDFILSAEITAITLSAIEADSVWTSGIVLAVIGIIITAVVYGTVALLVKADDLGLMLNQAGNSAFVRSLGRTIVKAMPSVMAVIGTVGTAAMLWVGGSIIVHGLDGLGLSAPYDAIHSVAVAGASAFEAGRGFVEWAITAALDGIIGLALGLALMPLIERLVVPVFGVLFPEKDAASEGAS